MSFSAAAPSDDEVNAARLDPARLQAVCDTGLLDTPAEESFDRLTRLAARLLEDDITNRIASDLSAVDTQSLVAK